MNSAVEQKPLGFREKKKEKIREQIVAVALRLFTERGYDETSVESIVEIVGVSKRSFFRYFQSKDDVVVAWMEQFVEQVSENLLAQPADKPPMLALERAFVDAVVMFESKPALTIAYERAIVNTPAILAQKLIKHRRIAQDVAKILAKRMHLSVDRDFAPLILAHCCIGILEAAIDKWRARGNKQYLSEILIDCFRHVNVDCAPESQGKRLGFRVRGTDDVTREMALTSGSRA